MFSPILAISARRRSSMLSPLGSLAAASAASVAGFSVSAACATACAKARKSCSRATKSVSQLISTIAAARSSADLPATTTPSAATRVAFLSALARPCLRMSSAAASRSPLVSTSALLHSIMPAPVRSRSCLTASAVMFMSVAASLAAARTVGGATRRRRRRRYYARGNQALGALLDVQIIVLDADANAGVGGRGRGLLLSGRLRLRGCRAAPYGSLLAHVGLRTLPAARLFLARVTGLVELDELVLANGHLRHGLLALEHRVGDAGGVQVNGAHGVIVARDHVLDAIGRAVGVDDRHDRNAELLRLVNRYVLVTDVDHKQGIGQGLHVLDAAEASLELDHLAPQLRRLLLTAFVQRAGSGQLGDLRQPLDGLADGLEVGEHAAEPALVHERLRGALRFLLHRLARRALGAHEQHRAAVGNHALDEVRRLRVHRLRLLKIDNVDFVALTEDKRGHLRVPEAGLMSEMDSRLQHLSHGHAGHEKLLVG